ncbi:MAG: metallophosphoesterase [Candidatus Methylomirabilis sp.]|nr:metallophosphoesterase [Deltaproteobacteria bacterium]
MISRRDFLRGGALLGGALLFESAVLAPRGVRVQEAAIRINGLPPSFNGFTICHLTDIHHSPVVGLGYIEKVVEEANSLSPDLFVLTGDYIDDGRKYMPPAVKALSGLKARFGTLAVLGNHDHFIGTGYTEEVMDSYRIPLLQNRHTFIESGRDAFCIGGVRDFLEDAPDAKEAFRGAPKDVPRILLSHHPDYAEYLPDDERVDLVLSGHTHGGQVRLPFSFAPVVPSGFGQKYSGGLVRNGATQVYVSRGVGVVMIPVRFNCPPEITLIRLVT